jgi:hypothetical protein
VTLALYKASETDPRIPDFFRSNKSFSSQLNLEPYLAEIAKLLSSVGGDIADGTLDDYRALAVRREPDSGVLAGIMNVLSCANARR